VKELKDFLEVIHSTYEPEGEQLNLNNKRFTIRPEVRVHIYDKSRLVYAGKLLGRTKGEFIPSASLLRELGRLNGPNKIWVDDKVGWLFVCGRDIFEDSIERSEGEFEEGFYFLVMIEDDCLGYGKVETSNGRKMLKNIVDLGDFLRRERGSEHDSG
jgi:ribosome biogenesis protein Nip4